MKKAVFLLALLVLFGCANREAQNMKKSNDSNEIIERAIQNIYDDISKIKAEFPQLQEIEKAKLDKSSFSYKQGEIRMSMTGKESYFEKNACRIYLKIEYPAGEQENPAMQIGLSEFVQLSDGSAYRVWKTIEAEPTEQGSNFTKKVNSIIGARLYDMKYGLELPQRMIETEKLKNLGRAKIIELASKIIKESYESFDANSFDRIKVLSNNKSVKVLFESSYIYMPAESVFFRNIETDLSDRSTHAEIARNPKENQLENTENFFVPNEESDKAIAFVRDAAKKAGISLNSPIIIRDNPDYYDIEGQEKDYSAGMGFAFFFKVNKKTMEIYDQSHKEFFLQPYERGMQEMK